MLLKYFFLNNLTKYVLILKAEKENQKINTEHPRISIQMLRPSLIDLKTGKESGPLDEESFHPNRSPFLSKQQQEGFFIPSSTWRE